MFGKKLIFVGMIGVLISLWVVDISEAYYTVRWLGPWKEWVWKEGRGIHREGHVISQSCGNDYAYASSRDFLFINSYSRIRVWAYRDFYLSPWFPFRYVPARIEVPYFMRLYNRWSHRNYSSALLAAGIACTGIHGWTRRTLNGNGCINDYSTLYTRKGWIRPWTKYRYWIHKDMIADSDGWFGKAYAAGGFLYANRGIKVPHSEDIGEPQKVSYDEIERGIREFFPEVLEEPPILLTQEQQDELSSMNVYSPLDLPIPQRYDLPIPQRYNDLVLLDPDISSLDLPPEITNFRPTIIPEPASMLLLSAGLLGLGGIRLRRKK
jgi:hypothetical protein